MKWLLAVALICGCKDGSGANGENGTQGPTGPTGATGPQGPGLPTVDGGAVFTCKPGESWCEGSVLNTCTRSGHDAAQYDCTDGNSGYVTVACVSPCPTSKAGACCKYTANGISPAATCTWALTAPESSSGDTSTSGYEFNCQGPNACAAADTEIRAFFRHTPYLCPPAGYDFTVRLTRSLVTVGQTITLPNAAVTVDNTNYVPAAASCTSGAWSGTVRLDADIPNWKMTINVSCTAGQTFQFNGVLSGNAPF